LSCSLHGDTDEDNQNFPAKISGLRPDLNMYPTEHKFREAPVTGTSPCLVKAVLHIKTDDWVFIRAAPNNRVMRLAAQVDDSN